MSKANADAICQPQKLSDLTVHPGDHITMTHTVREIDGRIVWSDRQVTIERADETDTKPASRATERDTAVTSSAPSTR